MSAFACRAMKTALESKVSEVREEMEGIKNSFSCRICFTEVRKGSVAFVSVVIQLRECRMSKRYLCPAAIGYAQAVGKVYAAIPARFVGQLSAAPFRSSSSDTVNLNKSVHIRTSAVMKPPSMPGGNQVRRPHSTPYVRTLFLQSNCPSVLQETTMVPRIRVLRLQQILPYCTAHLFVGFDPHALLR